MNLNSLSPIVISRLKILKGLKILWNCSVKILALQTINLNFSKHLRQPLSFTGLRSVVGQKIFVQPGPHHGPVLVKDWYLTKQDVKAQNAV